MDYSFRYSVSMVTVTGFNTPSGWQTKNRAGSRLPAELCGKPNAAKLARYVADYNASVLPGGCNAHIGPGGRCVSAAIKDHQAGTVVATWAE